MPPSFFERRLLAVLQWSRLALYKFDEARTKLCNILCHSRMETTRLIIALSSLTWAFLLLEGSVLFVPGRTTYAVMAAMLPENSWGVLFLISGCVGVWSLLFEIRNRITLALDALLGAALWTSSTLACFAAHWPSHTKGLLAQLAEYPAPAAMSGEFWLSVFAWWCLVRHVVDTCVVPPIRTRKEDL